MKVFHGTASKVSATRAAGGEYAKAPEAAQRDDVDVGLVHAPVGPRVHPEDALAGRDDEEHVCEEEQAGDDRGRARPHGPSRRGRSNAVRPGARGRPGDGPRATLGQANPLGTSRSSARVCRRLVRSLIGPMVPDPPGLPKTSLARPQPTTFGPFDRALAPDGHHPMDEPRRRASCSASSHRSVPRRHRAMDEPRCGPSCRALGHRNYGAHLEHQPCAHDQAGRASRSAGPRPPGQPTRRARRSCVPGRAHRNVPGAAGARRGSRRPCRRARSRTGSWARPAPRPRRR